MDQEYNVSFYQKIYSLEYDVAIANPSSNNSTHREQQQQGLGIEFLQKKRWYRRLCCFFKNLKRSCSIVLLLSFLNQVSISHRTRNDKTVLNFG